MNVIAWLEFELAYNDSAVYRFDNYTTRPHSAIVRIVSPYLQFFQAFYQYFVDCTKRIDYNLYKRHFHNSFFSIPYQVLGTSFIVLFFIIFFFFSVLLGGLQERWNPQFGRVSLFFFFCFFFFFFFFFTITRSSRLSEIKWSICISKSQRRWCISFSKTDSGLYKKHFSYGQISISCRPPTPQCCVKLYTYFVLHSLIMRLIVLSLSSHNLHILFCCII